MHLPAMAYDVLRNLAKGRTKINLELTGYDELLSRITGTVFHMVLALLACVLFLGACILCMTDIQPRVGGMPLISLLCFVISVALSIFTVQNMRRKK